jgi:hypothetical protein
VIVVGVGVALGTILAWGALFCLAGSLDVWLDPDWERDQGLVPVGDQAPAPTPTNGALEGK